MQCCTMTALQANAGHKKNSYTVILYQITNDTNEDQPHPQTMHSDNFTP